MSPNVLWGAIAAGWSVLAFWGPTEAPAQRVEDSERDLEEVPKVFERQRFSESGDTAIDDNQALLGNRYFIDDGNQWREVGTLPTDLQWAVELDGDWAVTGHPGDYKGEISRGHGEVFYFEGDSWTKTQNLAASDGDNWDEFGSEVAMDAGTAVISAPKDEAGEGDPELFDSPKRGSAYIFELQEESWVEKQKLTSPLEGSHRFGDDVAIDGDRMVVSNHRVEDVRGAAHVYKKGENGWELEDTLVAADATDWDRFGASVDIRGDTIVVGAPTHDQPGGPDDDDTGAAYLFRRHGTDWKETQELVPHDRSEQLDNILRFGSDVALTSKRAFVGAEGGTSNGRRAGVVYVFERGGEEWREAMVLHTTDPERGDWDFIGHSVVADEGAVWVGPNRRSQVYIYNVHDDRNRAPSIEKFDVSLEGAAAPLSVNFEWAVSDSEDDPLDVTLASGEGEHLKEFESGTDRRSYTHVYETAGDFTATLKIRDPSLGTAIRRRSITASPRSFGSTQLALPRGRTVDIAADGGSFAWSITGLDEERSQEVPIQPSVDEAELPEDEAEARTAIYHKQAGSWSLRDAVDDSAGALAYNNNHVVLGRIGADEEAGAAFVFDRDGGGWRHTQKLTIPRSSRPSVFFGSPLDLGENQLIVGTQLGVGAYVFHWTGSEWLPDSGQPEVQVDGDTGLDLDLGVIGKAAAIAGRFAAVGDAELTDWANGDPFRDTGAVFVYERAEEAGSRDWEQMQVLIPDMLDGSSIYGDQFGHAVDIDAGRLIASAKNDDVNGDFSGSAFIYRFNGEEWALEQRLLAADGARRDSFGRAVAIKGDYALVGARDDDVGRMDADGEIEEIKNLGSAYLFHYRDGEWVQQRKLVPQSRREEESFGAKVGFTEEEAFVAGGSMLQFYPLESRELEIVGLRRLEGGRINLQFMGKKGAHYVVETSRDLEDWSQVSSILEGEPFVRWTQELSSRDEDNAVDPGRSQRFFRVKEVERPQSD